MLAWPPLAPARFVGKTTKSLVQSGVAGVGKENLGGETGNHVVPLTGTPVEPFTPSEVPQSRSKETARSGPCQGPPRKRKGSRAQSAPGPSLAEFSKRRDSADSRSSKVARELDTARGSFISPRRIFCCQKRGSCCNFHAVAQVDGRE